MDAAIISIGTELTTGQCTDTNAVWLSAELTRRGALVVRRATVGDDVERIRRVISESLAAAEIVIVTGGLGPTPDDLTRQALAEAIGEPLEEHPEALRQVQALFERWRREMPESNRVQAMVPRGCEVVANPRGSAPGIWYKGGERQLIALPGVPGEMKAMFEASVAPELHAGQPETCTRSRRVLCFGLAEAKLGEILEDLMARDRNPLIGTTASGAVISVRVAASGNSESEAMRLLEADVAEIRRRLGSAVFGEDEDTLQAVVARLLVQRGKTVAVAESCSGGLLAKRLTDIAGSSAYFLRGLVTYSNQAKIELLQVPAELIESEGAVSGGVAEAMASACRTQSGSDFALSLSGIAGPGGGNPPEKPIGLVYVGLAEASGVEVTRLLIGDHLSRSDIRDRSCKAVLNLLRLRLLESGTR